MKIRLAAALAAAGVFVLNVKPLFGALRALLEELVAETA
jgi:hypothetical protein